MPTVSSFFGVQPNGADLAPDALHEQLSGRSADCGAPE